MARFNEILAARYNALFQKLFSMKGEAAVVQIATEVQPTAPIFMGVENRYLESWDRFATSQNIAAGGAGNNSVVRFRNPTGSNVMVVFEKLFFSNSAVLQPRVEIRAVNTDLGTVGSMPNSRFDARGRPNPTLVVSSQNNAAFALTTLFWVAVINAATGGFVDVILFDDQEITLLPGDSLTVLDSTLNTALNVCAMWRERLLEESERR